MKDKVVIIALLLFIYVQLTYVLAIKAPKYSAASYSSIIIKKVSSDSSY